MKQDQITCNWQEGMAFESLVEGHTITIDADAEFGGQDKGPRPKPLLLLALAGCTGMDVVALLKKMRVNYEKFRLEVTGDLTDEHPKYYKTIHIKYFFKGNDLPMDKLEKAINLSQDRYCSVSYMLKQASEVTFEILIENEVTV